MTLYILNTHTGDTFKTDNIDTLISELKNMDIDFGNLTDNADYGEGLEETRNFILDELRQPTHEKIYKIRGFPFEDFIILFQYIGFIVACCIVTGKQIGRAHV